MNLSFIQDSSLIVRWTNSFAVGIEQMQTIFQIPQTPVSMSVPMKVWHLTQSAVELRLCSRKQLSRVYSSGTRYRGCHVNGPVRHPVLLGLCMDETWLRTKARTCLRFPQEDNTTEEGVSLFGEERSFLGKKRQLGYGIRRSEGKALSLKNLEKPWWFSKPLMFDLIQTPKRVPERRLHQQLLWFSLTRDRKSSESRMWAHFHRSIWLNKYV